MNLTDDWKAGKLKTGWYFTTTAKGEVCPNLWFDNEWNDFMGIVEEVLAPCDYEEMAKQGAEIERLRKENDNLSALITGGELEIGHLRTLLRKCKPYIQKEMETIKGANFCNCDWAWKTSDLLTCINVALGESKE